MQLASDRAILDYYSSHVRRIALSGHKPSEVLMGGVAWSANSDVQGRARLKYPGLGSAS